MAMDRMLRDILNQPHSLSRVADSTYRALLFASQAATRRLDWALASDLIGFGGDVRGIATQASAAEGGAATAWTLPDLPEWTLPLVEIEPVQAAAYRLAIWRGFPPGEFRHGGRVTLNEESFGRT
jgi:fructoselysine-6-P-deglycase FrlB-like protein